MNRAISIQTKIVACLLFVALTVVGGSIAYIYRSERQLAFDMMLQQTEMTAHFYLDNLNIMMVNDDMEMDDREILQEKMLAQPGIVEARILRAPILDENYKKGDFDQYPRDDFDRRALEGEEFTLVQEKDGGRTLTRIFPVKALKRYRGTKCMGCHEEVEVEGTVLGAIRVGYSLNDFDERIMGNIAQFSIILTVLFATGTLITIYALNRLMTRPLRGLGQAIEDIEATSDLSRRVAVGARDEVGTVAAAYNSMLEKFQNILGEVSREVSNLTGASQRIAEVSDETVNAIIRQNDGTQLVAQSVAQMQATSSEVKANANATRKASEGADSLASGSVQVMESAIAAINELAAEIERTARVIQQVGEHSDKVGSVLGVINTIAEQTNLLALNAAIEAARAGESGRGFAVVASEVRGLATKTQNSTWEIQSMIEQLQEESGQAIRMVEPSRKTAHQGVAEAEKAVAALQEIAAHVAEIRAMNEEVAVASDEQNAAADQIYHNVIDISEISESTAERARETLEVSRQLVERARHLETVVRQFKLE